MSSEEAEFTTFHALKHGYRHIDTAAVYRNEDGVAKGVKTYLNDSCLLYTSPSPRD